MNRESSCCFRVYNGYNASKGDTMLTLAKKYIVDEKIQEGQSQPLYFYFTGHVIDALRPQTTDVRVSFALHS